MTLRYVLDAWLEMHEAELTTLEAYRGYADRTIRPGLGEVPIAKITARMLEQFYAQLRRCRTRCDGKALTEHRVEGEHECRDEPRLRLVPEQPGLMVAVDAQGLRRILTNLPENAARHGEGSPCTSDGDSLRLTSRCQCVTTAPVCRPRAWAN